MEMAVMNLRHKLFRGAGGLVVAVFVVLASAGIAFAVGRSTAPNPAAPTARAQASSTSAQVSAMMPWIQAHASDIAWMRDHMDDVTWS
jgi:hypothetical protein